MFTIGEFSHLSRVSPRMLRHYDALGLLPPAKIGENGYRYYAAHQLDVLHRIDRLKAYGFALAEIPELLTLPQEALQARIRAQYEIVRKKAADWQNLACRMQRDLREMEEPNMKNKYEVVLLQEPARRVFGLRRTIPCNAEHIDPLMNEFMQLLFQKGLQPGGAMEMRFFDEVFDNENADIEVLMPVLGDADGVYEIPASTCAATILHGAYDRFPEAYEAIGLWFEAHPEYEMDGVSYQRYLNNPHEVSPDALETAILFPVHKRA